MHRPPPPAAGPVAGLKTFFTLALLTSIAASQTPGGPANPPRGDAREAMWPAPTAEDWAKPVQITFQRTWEDAVAVSRETGKPILVCINMDGEIASEHYAGIRYRDPEIAKLYEPYVCVIASVYRHNPRDYDDDGARIPCPRFGSVTCSEHIWIEPVIFEKFCDGQRVAPRHIAVDLEGNETYDIYYRNDTASVFRDLERMRPEGRPTTVVRGDRPIVERVESRDVRDRRAVERAYREGDRALREKLLQAALEHRQADPIDLMRLAIFGLDVELSRTARTALAETDSPDAAELVSDALQAPMAPKEREALLKALERLGDESIRARYLAGVHRGLAGGPGALKLEGWERGRAGATYPAPEEVYGGAGRVAHVEETARAAEQRPEDPAARLELAEATLALALKAGETWTSNPRMARLASRHLYEDARRYATEAKELGAAGWPVESTLALAAYYGGDAQAAYAHAEEAIAMIPPGDAGWASMALVTVFAESRWKAIRKAVRDGERWPPEYLTDLDNAYTLLLRHPLGTDRQVLWHYELLDWLGVHRRAGRVLREGLDRFVDSPLLHASFRERALKFRGPDGLQTAYDDLLAREEEPARLAPFAAVAAFEAAETLRRTRRHEEALEAYARAIAHWERALEADPSRRDEADRAIALALAGRARIGYQLARDELALADLLAAFERSPESAGTRDGIGITPGETAQMLLARLRDQQRTDMADRLAEALSAIDPELLRPDIGLTPEEQR